MSLLKKSKATDNLDTLIGNKTIFEGILISNESITIEGTVKGKIECKGSVVVGQGGKVKAEIVAGNVLVGGRVNGNITAKDKLEITSTGIVKGDIETASLVIAEGVVFDGNCRMNCGKSEAASPSTDSKSALKKGPEIEKKLYQISNK
jgi:cytoskeletal protein CcmA (bactofilin family)